MTILVLSSAVFDKGNEVSHGDGGSTSSGGIQCDMVGILLGASDWTVEQVAAVEEGFDAGALG